MKFRSKLRCMTHPATGLLRGMIALAYGTTAVAQILSMSGLELDFTKPKVAEQASWTQSAYLKLGPSGLVNEAPGNVFVPLQLQTTEPIAIGLAWRPARSASIDATLSPVSTSKGRMFVRYSPDTKHWSSWQVLSSRSAGPAVYAFSGELVVPQQERDEYDKMCLGIDDAEACAQQVVTSQPDYFAKHIPFIGYVEVLYEADFHAGQRIEHLNIYIPWGVGGLTSTTTNKTTPGPWRFRAK